MRPGALATRLVTVKTTGHEKTCVSVFLAAVADDIKLTSFIVFKEAKKNMWNRKKIREWREEKKSTEKTVKNKEIERS